jgi:hypothetical protein
MVHVHLKERYNIILVGLALHDIQPVDRDVLIALSPSCTRLTAWDTIDVYDHPSRWAWHKDHIIASLSHVQRTSELLLHVKKLALRSGAIREAIMLSA